MAAGRRAAASPRGAGARVAYVAPAQLPAVVAGKVHEVDGELFYPSPLTAAANVDLFEAAVSGEG